MDVISYATLANYENMYLGQMTSILISCDVILVHLYPKEQITLYFLSLSPVYR